MIKVSVIVPVYNVENYLRACLDSIINQTLKDIEIICVNDGSTDSSLAILQEYARNDKRIKIIDSQNKGSSAARNIGIDVAQGDYIGFVDSDDWIDLNFYETLYNAAVSQNADIARTCYDYNYKNKVVEEKHLNAIIHAAADNNRDLKINEHSVVIWNAIYKNRFLKSNNIRFLEDLSCSVDVTFTAQTTFLSTKTIPVIGTYYHHRDDVPNQLSLLTLHKIKTSALASSYVIDFINSIPAQKEDYIETFHRCVWRFDYIFKSGIKNVQEFNEQLQIEYLLVFSNCLSKFKYKDEYDRLFDILGVNYVKENKKKKYINLIKSESNIYTKDYTFLQRIFSMKNRDQHKVMTILGIKFKFKNTRKNKETEGKFNSANYWCERYLNNGNSGAGSYGRLAQFKADVINGFVKENNVKSVIEYGFGDGNQLSLFNFEQYLGFDVSDKVVDICRQKFKNYPDYIFKNLKEYKGDKAELVLSLDVVYHLIEDEIFDSYMKRLFASAEKFVIIYSSNKNEKHCTHVKHRKFTDWIDANVSHWKLLKFIPNKYTYDANNQKETSFADFYIYSRSK